MIRNDWGRVTFGSGKNRENLRYGEDFTIVPGSYQANVAKGTASVTLQGCGKYGGNKTIKFKITAKGFGKLFQWMK